MSLILTGVTRTYPGAKARTVDKLDLDVPAGTLLCLLGPSGCGKTTTLRMIAGLDQVDDGSITIGDHVVDAPGIGKFVAPDKRSVGLVFQHYALWPHLKVRENVEFGLREQRVPRPVRRQRTGEILERLSLASLAERYPGELSGGQQQRVALARTLVVRPKLLLLDEPLSNLDARLRGEMRETIRTLHREFNCTTVFVTHDQAEAMVLSDRIAVMHEGRLAQFGAPLEIYNTPATVEVARFIGEPPMNLLPADHPFVASVVRDPRVAIVGVRPQSLQVRPAGDWTVRSALPTGTSWVHTLEKDGTVLYAHLSEQAGRPGDQVSVSLDVTEVNYFSSAGARLSFGRDLCNQ